jgi:hypothetical protein
LGCGKGGIRAGYALKINAIRGIGH